MLASAATPIGQIGASVPPVTTTSHSPVRMSRRASWKAMTEVAHAATWVMTGPVRPHSMDSMAAPIDPDRAGTANGETKRGPRVSWACVPSMICSMPPPPVFTTTPTRSRWSGSIAAKSMPLSATASLPAAIAKWMNRLIRRAILASMWSVGWKSSTSAAMRTSCADASKLWINRVPVTPACRFAQYVGKSLPMGITAPRPVITARRAGSRSGIESDCSRHPGPFGSGAASAAMRRPSTAISRRRSA